MTTTTRSLKSMSDIAISKLLRSAYGRMLLSDLVPLSSGDELHCYSSQWLEKLQVYGNATGRFLSKAWTGLVPAS